MIVPADDPTWPGCSHGEKHWCEEVADKLRSYGDLVHIGEKLCVPYLPAAGLFAECKIGDEVSPAKMPGVYRLYVVKNVPLIPAPHNREEIELALWSQGEGRASICLTVRDWVRGLAAGSPEGHVRCKFIRHGYRENVKSQRFNQGQWEQNDFYCATESACWFCYHANAGDDVGSLMDPLDDKPSPSQAHIRGQLRKR